MRIMQWVRSCVMRTWKIAQGDTTERRINLIQNKTNSNGAKQQQPNYINWV